MNCYCVFFLKNSMYLCMCLFLRAGEICDAIEAFQKVAGKPKRTNTLRSIPKDLVNSMDTVRGGEGRLPILDLFLLIKLSDMYLYVYLYVLR